MQKIICGVFAGLSIFILGIAAYLMINYHTTPEGAFNELDKKTEGQILQLADIRSAVLINEKDGSVSFAQNYVFNPFGLYKDYKLYPTNLNIYDLKENEILYINAPALESLSFGFVKNKQIEYTIAGELGLVQQNAIKVFPIEKYINAPELRGVKLWYVFHPVQQDTIKNDIAFLNNSKEVIPIEKDFVQK